MSSFTRAAMPTILPNAPAGMAKPLLEQIQDAIIGLEDHLEDQVAASVTNLVAGAPEALNTLKEISDAINADPDVATTLSSAITAVHNSLNEEVTARGNALTTLSADRAAAVEALIASGMWLFADQSAFPAAADNHGRIVHSHADGAMFYSHAGAWHKIENEAEAQAARNALQSALDARLVVLEGDPTTATAVTAVQADVDQNELDSDAADTALSNRLDTLEADPTTATAVAAVQADVDQNETDADAADAALSARIDVLEADPTTATAVTAIQADVDQNETDGDAADAALSGRLDTLEADPTTKTYVDTQVAGLVDSAPGLLNTLDELAAALGDDANFATTITNSIAAVQTDVDANETASDAAEAALSGRLDTLEADPTTAAAVASAVASVQADVDQNEADADTAIALKLDIASPAATGTLTVDTNASLKFDSNLTKVENVLRGTGINIGNNIELIPAAAGGRVEITGDVILDASDLTDAANDTAAAAAGVVVGQIYHNSGALRIRLS